MADYKSALTAAKINNVTASLPTRKGGFIVLNEKREKIKKPPFWVGINPT